jgi:hypothetical protein
MMRYVWIRTRLPSREVILPPAQLFFREKRRLLASSDKNFVMAKKIIYLHIGTTKTGSTSIQMLLQENRAVLRRKNIAVYTFCRRERADVSCQMRGLVAYLSLGLSSFRTAKKSVEWYHRFLQELKDESADRVIVSEECLWDVVGSWRKRRRFRQFIDDLRVFADVRVLVYLRRQDNFLMSAYQQNLKGGQLGGLTCRRWLLLSSGGKSRADYRRCLTWILSLIEKEHLTIRPFETAQFVQGDLLTDFLHNVGLNIDDGFSVPTIKRNPGLSPFLAEIIRCLGFFYTEQDPIRPLFWLKWTDGGKFFKKNMEHQFLSPRDRRRLMEKYQEGNRWIAKELLGREDGVLFKDALPLENDVWTEYHLNEEDVRSFFLGADCLKLSPDQRAQMCNQVLSVIRCEAGFARMWRTEILVIYKRIVRKLRAISGDF